MDAVLANEFLLPAGLKHLPADYDSINARAVLLTVFMQESDLHHRIQLLGASRRWWESLKGPARGFAMFETAGIRGVLQHHASRQQALTILDRLRYPEKVGIIHRAVAHNDPLMVAMARLLLYTVPEALPESHEFDKAWDQYVWAWRPGHPRRDRWNERYATAWDVVLRRSS